MQGACEPRLGWEDPGRWDLASSEGSVSSRQGKNSDSRQGPGGRCEGLLPWPVRASFGGQAGEQDGGAGGLGRSSPGGPDPLSSSLTPTFPPLSPHLLLPLKESVECVDVLVNVGVCEPYFKINEDLSFYRLPKCINLPTWASSA